MAKTYENRVVENQTFDEERAFYGARNVKVNNVKIDGPADGESAFKECRDVECKDCFFNLRYPFWHDHNLKIENSEMTQLCRASLWYSENIDIKNVKMHGIKALRECKNVTIDGCDIVSPEFGWSTHGVSMTNSHAESEYFMMRATAIRFKNVDFKGKYSFQYIKDAVFEDCNFDTKDAFWHAENVTVKNCVVKGEYLAWYCDGVTFDHCKIIGTQPLCYCKNLKLIDCEMIDCDFAFERSDVEATITTPVISVKNVKDGYVMLPSVQEIIWDDDEFKGAVVILDKEEKNE